MLRRERHLPPSMVTLQPFLSCRLTPLAESCFRRQRMARSGSGQWQRPKNWPQSIPRSPSRVSHGLPRKPPLLIHKHQQSRPTPTISCNSRAFARVGGSPPAEATTTSASGAFPQRRRSLTPSRSLRPQCLAQFAWDSGSHGSLRLVRCKWLTTNHNRSSGHGRRLLRCQQPSHSGHLKTAKPHQKSGSAQTKVLFRGMIPSLVPFCPSGRRHRSGFVRLTCQPTPPGLSRAMQTAEPFSGISRSERSRPYRPHPQHRSTAFPTRPATGGT